MIAKRTAWLSAFFICVWFLPGIAAAAEKPEEVDIQVMPLPSRIASDGTTHGYVEFRVRLRNNSDRARTTYLSYPGFEPSFRSGESGVITREVTVEKRQEAWVSIYQPPIEVSSNKLEVSVEGMDKPKLFTAQSTYGTSYHWGASGGAVPAMLFGRNVPQEFRDRVVKEESGLPENERSVLFRSELPTGQWSPNWLGYSCYDAIVLTESEAAELPPAARTAIRRYVECGGKLVVHGRQLPEAFTQGSSPGGTGVYHAGLGRMVSTGDDAAGWNVAYTEIEHSPSKKIFVQEYQAAEGVEPAGIKPPSAKVGKISKGSLVDWLVKEADFPAKTMFLLLTVFAVGIGPVNIWMLAKHKKRIWLWWNVPVISFAACLAIFFYAMFSEGWSGRGKAVSFTILDERSHRAATIENLSYYCPLTPSSGLHFSPECEVTIIHRRHYPTSSSYRDMSREDNVRRTVDWTNDQTFGSGWITARVAAGFQVRKNEDRLERLIVRKKSDDAIRVVNALGADIKKLWLADASGRVYEGPYISAGAEVEIQLPIKGARASGKGPADLRKLILRAPGEYNIDEFPFDADTSELLAPGTYLAVLSDSPFIESPMAGVSLAGSPAVVYGISKAEEDGR
jgi:hypothetical protein